MNAVAGAASGQICEFVVRHETTSDDIAAMKIAKGVLTASGGKTSHAAIIARQFGVPCVCGLGEKVIDAILKLSPSEDISIDGGTGNVYMGKMRTRKEHMNRALTALELCEASTCFLTKSACPICARRLWRKTRMSVNLRFCI